MAMSPMMYDCLPSRGWAKELNEQSVDVIKSVNLLLSVVGGGMQPNTETGRNSAGAALLLPTTLSFIYRHYCPVLQHQLPALQVLLLSLLHIKEKVDQTQS